MTGASRVLRAAPRWPYKIGLILSIVYCLVAGVLALSLPSANGVDLSVCYVAGVATRRGSSPYSQTELTNTRSTLNTALAAKPSYPFAYPPSAIPACVLFSFLRWESAQALWKLLNIAFLIGSVLFTFRLFSHLRFTREDRYLAWSFAFIFSPTVTVLLVGQASLFVLFTALLTMVLYRLKNSWPPGLSLALALTKPHLTFPLVLFFLYRRRFNITAIALTTFATLGILGLYLSHSNLELFLQGLSRYATLNDPTNPRLIGIQQLATGVFGLPVSVTRMLSATCGMLFLGVAFIIDSKDPSRELSENIFPLLMLVSVFAFGAHSYDLVFLIPVCIWAIARSRSDRRYLLIVILCFILTVPLNAVTIFYDKLLSHSIPLSAFRILIEPFRSWILLVLFLVMMYLSYRQTVWQRHAGERKPGA